MGRIALEGDLIAERSNWTRSGSRVVLAYGVFDLLHPGHIRLLEQASSLGDVLVVAVQSDVSAEDTARGDKLQKGDPRPVTPVAERAEILAALAAVDYVLDLDMISLPELVERLLPDVLVKGAAAHESGLTEADIRAEEIVKRAGGVVSVIPPEPGYSTGSVMARIRQLHA